MDEETGREGFLMLPGMEGVAVVDPLERSRVVSAEAKAVFEGRHGEDPDWLLYWELAEGFRWPWRKAAYITWVVMPRDRREIKTEGEFAVSELGLTSARMIREWKSDSEFIEFIKRMAQDRLVTARWDIWGALIRSASDDNPRNHPDRKMALEMLRDYKQSGTLHVGPLPENLAELPVEEKRERLRELRRREELGSGVE